MAVVTKQKYFIENRLLEMLDLMINRMTGKRKMDNLIIIDGDEGYGKSTISIQIANYVAQTTGRPFSVDNVFFNIDDMTKFAVETSDQVIVWDEAALAGLASEWQNKSQKKLIKLLMVARKKRHFWIFNIPKFFKLNEYLVIDRSVGLIHVYARQETQLGRFVYFSKKRKERLYHNWRKNKFRAYNKYKSFSGSFPKAFETLIDADEYDRRKDEAILSIDAEPLTRRELKTLKLQYLIATLKGMTFKEKGEHFGFDPSTISEWIRNTQKYPELKEELRDKT